MLFRSNRSTSCFDECTAAPHSPRSTMQMALRLLRCPWAWRPTACLSVSSCRPITAKTVCCWTFSELTPDEQTYTLSTAYSCLKPGGVIVIADEVVPEDSFNRFRHRLVSLPLVLVTYILTQTTTHPLRNLSPLLQKAGFANIETTSMWSSFVIIRAFREVEP